MSASDPVRVVVAVHGWGIHSGRMAPLFRAISDRGAAVIGVDLPGHGLSRETAFTLRRSIGAIRAAVDYATQRYPDASVHLVAESGGANFVLMAANSQGVPRIESIALIAPGVIPRRAQVLSRRALRDSWALIVHGTLDHTGWRLGCVCDCPEYLADWLNDPLTLKVVNRRYVLTMVLAGLRTVIGYRQIRAAMRIWQGDADRILNPRGATYLRWRTGHNATIEMIPNGPHGLIWAAPPESQFLEHIATWLVPPA